jgi:SAM-dependent MidA family methyltransferase
MGIGWREAMTNALYGPAGFFTGSAPAAHFRTSVHASPLFAGALMRLIERTDHALGEPERLDVVDVGAGRGELLATLATLMPDALAGRVRLTAVEVADRPAGLSADVTWRPDLPDEVVGVLVATEWLDNVPVDVAEVGDDEVARLLLVDPATGDETPGGPIGAADRVWLNRWWPFRGPGTRAEIGWPRDGAWADAVGRLRLGLAVAVDYGHLRDARPPLGTMAGYRGGRQVAPLPDGTCDVTAHVAMDAVASAAGAPYALVTQREALRALGVDGGRPPLELSRTDPAAYLRALAAAGAAGELLDPGGLGGHWWLVHGVGIDARGIISA